MYLLGVKVGSKDRKLKLPAELAPVYEEYLTKYCNLTNDDTMLVCQITPSGATWGTGDGFVVFNVRLTATSGHAQISAPVVVRLQLTSVAIGNNTIGVNNSTGIGVGKITINR